MKNKRGFTLAELLAIIVILSVIVLIAIPAYTTISKNVKNSQNNNLFSYLESQAEKYSLDNNLYNDSDITIINVETLIEQGYLDSDKIKLNKAFLYDAFGKDITCYQIKIENINGKPEATFINKPQEHNNGTCAIDYGDNTIELEAYNANTLINLRPDAIDGKKTTKYYHLDWTASNVILAVKLNDNNITEDAIKEIKWTVVNEIKDFKNDTDEWFANPWLNVVENNKQLQNYNANQQYRNVYLATTNRIMNDTKFKASVTLEYQEGTEIINKVVSSYIYIKIDREAPSVTATVDENWSNNTNGKIIYVTGNDNNGSGIKEFWIYNAENGTQTCNINNSYCEKINFLNNSKVKGSIEKPAGNYKIYAIDNADNMSSHIDISVGNIDNEGPKCIYEGASNIWKKGTRVINIKCEDNGSGCATKTINVPEINTTSVIKTQKLIKSGTGSNIKYYEIKDKAGNTTICNDEINIYLDNQAPTLVKSGESTTWVKDKRNIKLSCNDGSGSGCSIYDNNTKTYKDNITLNYTSTTKTSKYNYTIKDKVGNILSSSVNLNVYVDNEAPETVISRSYNYIMITMSDSYSNLNGYVISEGSKTLERVVFDSNTSSQIITFKASYAATYSITVYDNVGNYSVKSVEVPASAFNYTVTYAAAWVDKLSFTSKTVNANNPIGNFPTVEIGPGIKITGWYLANGTQVTENTKFTSDVTLYARSTLTVVENGNLIRDNILLLADNGCSRNHYYHETNSYVRGEDCSNTVGTQNYYGNIPAIYGNEGGGAADSISPFEPGVNIAFVINPIFNNYQVEAELGGYISKRNDGDGSSLDNRNTTLTFYFDGGQESYTNVYTFKTIKVIQTISSSTFYRIKADASYNSNSDWAPHGFGGIRNLKIYIE